MKQARTGLLVALALMAVPAATAAQGKGAKPKEAAAADAKPKAGAPDAKKPAAQPGTEGVTEIDADAPEPGAAAEPPKAGAEPGAAASPEGGLGDICQIDPDACPKISMQDAAKRDLKPQMYAVQQIYALRARRFELQPYWSFTMNDQFVSHPGPGVGLNYYITNVMAVGLNFNWYQGMNADSSFNAYTRRAVRVGVPLNEYQWSGAANFTYVPMYGKFAGFGDFIFHWDAYVVGGVGAISTRPVAVFDPSRRSFSYEPKVAFNAGLGVRIFFNRWFAGILELRDYIYNEKLENDANYDAMFMDIQNDSQRQDARDAWRDNAGNWMGGSKLTNNVQIQAGVSIFLPFTWEYRLPK
jgi:outer membrane beta-barrel protein